MIMLGFAYVEFADQQAAQMALQMNGAPLHGRPIKVELTGADGGPPKGEPQPVLLASLW